MSGGKSAPAAADAAAAAAAGAKEPSELAYCVEILTGGFVQSYVDFFYLQHKNDEAEGSDGQDPQHADGKVAAPRGEDAAAADAGTASQSDREVDLAFIQEKLTSAEKARRGGAPTLVFENYRDLATAFCEKGDFQTGTVFYGKGLKVSQLVNDVAGEKEARYHLGVTLQRLAGKTTEAIEHLERFVELAAQDEDSQARLKGRQQLATVYAKRAQELEDGPTSTPQDRDAIVDYLERVVRIASEEKNAAGKAQANARLGRAFSALGKPERAIVALSQSLDYFQKSGNLASMGGVCEHLAEAYLQMDGKTAKAVEYLEQALELARQTYNAAMEASACRSLGLVHAEAGNHDAAVRCLEQNFEIVRKHQSEDNRIVDNARVLLGVAMRNARAADLMRMVQTDVSALLDWRVGREFPGITTS